MTVIQPPRRFGFVDLRELWQTREILWTFVWRDIKVRYKQTMLGAAWAILQPFLAMVTLALFFGRLAAMPSEGLPYPLFAYAGLVPWTLFAHVLVESTNSMVSNQQLISKVYFPRLHIPLGIVLAALADLAFALPVVGLLLIYYRVPLTPAILLLPLWIVLAAAAALAVGVWLAALNVRYRDVRYTVPFLTQLWMFATPIAYPVTLVPPRWRALYGLNPMTGVVEGFRWSLCGKQTTIGPLVWVSFGAVATLLVSGLAYFRRVERELADIV